MSAHTTCNSLPESPSTTRESLLDKLNQSQHAAVTAPFDGHVLVLAGAGCGKTAVLTRRIAFCAAFFCPQDRILALTFTRKAAGEMKERVTALNGIDRQKPRPAISTFHGFCLHLLNDTYEGKPLYARLGFQQTPHLISDRDRLKLLAACSTAKQRAVLGCDLFGIENMVSRFFVSPDKLDSFSSEQGELIARIAQDYDRMKLRENSWEFSDMIGYVLKACDSIGGYAEHVSSRFDAILVDEFQDTNPLQIQLLQHLLGKSTKLFAVGDDDQAIYGFRGADPRPILSFDRVFAAATLIRLETNYRNRPAILGVANGIFSDKAPEIRKFLQSGIYAEKKQHGTKPVKRIFADQHRMVKWIGERMGKLSGQGFEIADMTVLCRLNESCSWIEKRLGERGGSEILPRIMTVHAAKGLEFPVVFVCDLEEGIFPSYRIKRKKFSLHGFFRAAFGSADREREKEAIKEERRLFYVAVTRAQHHLFCCCVRKRFSSNRSVETVPSRFLKYIR